MGDDLKAGGRYRVDEEGNVSEKPAEPKEPLTESEKERARKVFPGVDMDGSGYWEEDEVVALYKAGDSRGMFAAMDSRPRNTQVSEAEFVAHLPKLKPHKGTKSLKFTLRHLEKNVQALTRDFAVAKKSCSLEMEHYVADRGTEAVDLHTDAARMATYQIRLRKDQSVIAAKNLYVEVVLPRGVKVTRRFFYREGNVPFGQAPTELCTTYGKDGEEVQLRCKVPTLDLGITIYVHATYPEDEYDDDEVDSMRETGSIITAKLMVAKEVVVSTSTPALLGKGRRAEL